MNTLRYLALKLESLLHSTDMNGYSILHWAVQTGQSIDVQHIIDAYKIDPTARDKVCICAIP